MMDKSRFAQIAQIVIIAQNTLKTHSEVKNLTHHEVLSLVQFINKANSNTSRQQITDRELNKIFNIAQSSQSKINVHTKKT